MELFGSGLDKTWRQLALGSESSHPVVVQGYDPKWPVLFELLRARIAIALEGIVAAIEHVGSTSVPGLAAKPIIDMDALLMSGD